MQAIYHSYSKLQYIYILYGWYRNEAQPREPPASLVSGVDYEATNWFMALSTPGSDEVELVPSESGRTWTHSCLGWEASHGSAEWGVLWMVLNMSCTSLLYVR